MQTDRSMAGSDQTTADQTTARNSDEFPTTAGMPTGVGLDTTESPNLGKVSSKSHHPHHDGHAHLHSPFEGDAEKRAEMAAHEAQEAADGDVIWVEFEENDPENPFNWSKARKWTITALAVFFTAEVAATASAYVPGISKMEAELGNKHEVSLLGISIYALGFSLPPLVLAPFSEVFGRNGVYLLSHAVYTLFFIGVATAQNIETVIICRFLGGAAGSTGSTMVGGTIAGESRVHSSTFEGGGGRRSFA